MKLLAFYKSRYLRKNSWLQSLRYNRIYQLLICVLLITNLIGTQAEAKPCLYENAPWTCVGSVELTLKGEGTEGIQIVRFIRYTNDEVMFEIEKQGIRKQYLRVLPSSLGIYSGLSEDELSETQPGNNPFSFLDMLFTYPMESLQLAHPSGPTSVTDKPKETAITLERRSSAKVTTSRLSTDSIGFHLEVNESNAGDIQAIDGVWHGVINKPLPNDMKITNWKLKSDIKLTTLGEARKWKK